MGCGEVLGFIPRERDRGWGLLSTRGTQPVSGPSKTPLGSRQERMVEGEGGGREMAGEAGMAAQSLGSGEKAPDPVRVWKAEVQGRSRGQLLEFLPASLGWRLNTTTFLWGSINVCCTICA